MIAAAGSGFRFSGSCGIFPKQFLFLESVLERFSSISDVNKIVCVVPGQYLDMFPSNDMVLFTCGAESRQASVFNGLKTLKEYSPTHVLIHDAARPYCSEDIIDRVIRKLFEGTQAVVPVISPVDSVRIHCKPVDKNSIFLIQTPQGFIFDLIYKLHEKYEKITVLDDASLCDLEGIDVNFVKGEALNKKITYKSDLLCCDFKVGFGFDSHEFSTEKSRKLKLCGVEIPDFPGLKGVSDADVAVHSIIDSILGAIGRGSIGEFFPETSEYSQNADSIEFLKIIARVMFNAFYMISNVDMTIVCNSPRISTYSQEMAKNIADCLMTDISSVNIKGKTTEGTRIEGIAAFTNVLLQRIR